MADPRAKSQLRPARLKMGLVPDNCLKFSTFEWYHIFVSDPQADRDLRLMYELESVSGNSSDGHTDNSSPRSRERGLGGG